MKDKYFVYDPEDNFLHTFSTEKDAEKYAKKCIEYHHDEGWSDTVDEIIMGVIIKQAKQKNKIMRPPENEIDEETGEDKDGNIWCEKSWTYQCEYKMEDVK